jgi:uncharacterized membrane protein YeaQ/YmgE (transglycosylase-associated protein family)
MLVGVAGGLMGGWLWTSILDQDRATGFLGAIVVATLGSVIVLLVLRAMRGDGRT